MNVKILLKCDVISKSVAGLKLMHMFQNILLVNLGIYTV